MFRKFSNALKIAQNIPSDLTVKFSLLNVSKGKLCFSCRIYDILNGKITIFFFFKADLCSRTCEFVRTVLIVQVEFVIGFNFSYGIYYLMTKMVLIFHIPESVVRLKSHGVRLKDDIYRYFRVSLSITSET